VIRAAVLPAAALAATPAFADFGAIAYAPESGAWGVAEAASRGEAEDGARRTCAGYGGDCVSAAVFEGACGALARGDGDANWGAMSGPNIADRAGQVPQRSSRSESLNAIKINLRRRLEGKLQDVSIAVPTSRAPQAYPNVIMPAKRVTHVSDSAFRRHKAM
jgi:hypothetical protein